MAAPSPGIQDTKCPQTAGHPLLSDLSEKAFHILGVFEDLPVDIQMEGLDVLQNVVNSVMHKITRGRVTAVKFVPVEGSAVTGENNVLDTPVTIKEEPVDTPWGITSQDSGCVPSHQTQVSNCQNSVESQVNHTSVTSPGTDAGIPDTIKTVTGKKLYRKRSSSHKTLSKPAPVNKTLPQKNIADKVGPQQKAKTPKKRKKKGTEDECVDTTTNLESGITKKKGKKSSKVSSKSAFMNTEVPALSQTENIMDSEENGSESISEKVIGKVTQQDDHLINSFIEDAVLTPESDKKLPVSSPDISSLQKIDLSPISPKSTCHAEVLALIPHKMRVIPPEKRKKRVARKVPGRFQCQHCSYSSDKKFHFDAHLIVHTGEKRFCCDICDKVFTAASSLKRHVMAHEGVKPHECPICRRTFTDMAGLRTHSVVHTGERLYGCEKCDKVYTNSANLSRHRRVHTGEMPYVCKVPECDARFRDLSSLKLHNLKHTGEKPYTCEFCGMRFKTSSDYLRHKRSHTNERNYECELCGKKFIQGWHLKQHQKMHTDLRPWQCDLCEKKFRSKASLSHHTKWHAGIKEYKCETCAKMFSTKKYLEAHQVIHTNLKPYKCKTCGTYFNQISNLKRHERMHSDVRRYKCSFCPKAFKYINSWRYHEGIHRGDLLTCEKCGVSMRSNQGLKAHKCSPTAMERRITEGSTDRKPPIVFESLNDNKDQDRDTDLEDLDEDERREILEAQELVDEFDHSLDLLKLQSRVGGTKTGSKPRKLSGKPYIKPLRIKLPKLPLPISNIRSYTRKQTTPKKKLKKTKVNKVNSPSAIADGQKCAEEIKSEPEELDELDPHGKALGQGADSCDANEAVNGLDATERGSVSSSLLSKEVHLPVDKSSIEKGVWSKTDTQDSEVISSHKHSEMGKAVDCFNGFIKSSAVVVGIHGCVSGRCTGLEDDDMASLDDMRLMKDAYTSDNINGE